MAVLNQTISRSPKFLEQTDTPQAAFVQAKDAFADATVLQHQSPDALQCLNVAASDEAVGAVLELRLTGKWKLLAFFSRKLRRAKTKYSAFDRELLSMHLSVTLESAPPPHARFDHVLLAHRQASDTFLPWVIGLRDGPKQYLCMMSLLILVQEYFYATGKNVLVFQVT